MLLLELKFSRVLILCFTGQFKIEPYGGWNEGGFICEKIFSSFEFITLIILERRQAADSLICSDRGSGSDANRFLMGSSLLVILALASADFEIELSFWRAEL